VTLEVMEEGSEPDSRPLPPAARAELLHVLRLPDLDRVERIGEGSGGVRRRGPSPSF
jgi:hypothetical protein